MYRSEDLIQAIQDGLEYELNEPLRTFSAERIPGPHPTLGVEVDGYRFFVTVESVDGDEDAGRLVRQLREEGLLP